MDAIGNLYAYAIDRYPYPTFRWNKRKFELRCHEIHTYDRLITLCFDNPYKNPKDILEWELVLIEVDILTFKNYKKRQRECIAAKNVIETLLNVL